MVNKTASSSGLHPRPPGLEKRLFVRYSCVLEVSWRSSDAVEFGCSWPAVILNISRGGVCLLLNQSVDMGDLLTIGMEATTQEFLPPLKVRVVRVFERSNGDWEIGAVLLQPLTDSELRAILQD
jgi:hypothetical protein